MDFRRASRAGRVKRLGGLTFTSLVLLLALTVAPVQANVTDYALNSEAAALSSTQAGGHPDFETKFVISGNTAETNPGQVYPWGRARDIAQQLPPGLIGNPSAFPTCPTVKFVQQLVTPEGAPDGEFCPRDSQIGTVSPGLFNFVPAGLTKLPLYNLPAPPESEIVARLGFIAVFYPLFIDIRLDPKRDYALTATVKNVPSNVPLTASFTQIWGVPTASVHDIDRVNWREALCTLTGSTCTPHSSGLEPTPFMLNPTSCGAADVGFTSHPYQDDSGDYFGVAPLPAITGCEEPPFEPSLSLAPSTRSTAASGGIDMSLKVPQDGVEDPNGLASAHLRKAVVTLPEGISINSSSADGLGSCTQAQIGVDRIERQIVAVKSGGSALRLSFEGHSTPELPYLASPAEVQAALEALPGIGAGNVGVDGRVGGPWTVDFVGSLAGRDVPAIEGVQSELVGLVVKANGGTYTITYDGNTTGSIPFNASAAEVQAALEALGGSPGIEPANISVDSTVLAKFVASRPYSRLYHFAFKGSLGGVDVPTITTSGAVELTGSGRAAKILQFAEGGAPVQTRTVKQGGTLGFDGDPVACPDSSKVGTGTITTPVFEDPLTANLYIASQNDNPFNSLLAGYMVAEGHGARIKVAGKFDLNPNTGQIVATFDNNPQTPFNDLELHFKGGNRGVITTPKECGTYQTKYELVPWSGTEPVTGISEFTLDGNCAPKPFAPDFNTGSSSALAGDFTSFNVKVTRDSGSPQLSGIAVEPPEGLTGRLAGIPYCPEAALASVPSALGTGVGQLASPSCPAASRVGTVTAGAGSGAPFYLDTGRAYLAGPYKGAPISMAVIAPVVSGPFDLGNVLVRTPIYVNPVTARIRAASDSLPSMLSGIPLDLRDVRVSLDRQGFTINPTSCEPMAVAGTITATNGASADVSDRFQVGECAALGFKPKLALKLKGGTKRGKHPALTAILRPRAGDANIASISVAFPRAEFLDQAHIGTVCTRVQWAADQCPAASVYGKVSATSPLLDSPLTGNVYLRSSDHELPDLVTDLRGPASQPIRFEAAGRNDSVNRGLRSSFEFVPDAPISRVVLQMRGGKKGLLQNSRNLCAHTYKANVAFTAHNGRTLETQAPLRAACKGKKAKRGKRGGRG